MGAHNGGFFVSEDDGRTWERRTNGLAVEHVFCLRAHTEGVENVVYAGTEPVSLFRSADEGRNWIELPSIRHVPGNEKWTFPPPPHIAHTKSLTFAANDPKTIYLSVEQGGLLKTTDGGLTWRELDSYYQPTQRTYRDIHCIVPMPSNPNELFMTTGVGIFKSMDAGETWTHIWDETFRVAYPDQLILSPDDENVMFLSGAARPPSTWRDARVAEGTIMKSMDRGRTWTVKSKGLTEAKRPNFEAMSMATWPGGFALFAGNTDGEIYWSADGAESWSLIADRLPPVSKVGHFRFLMEGSPAA